MLVAAGLHGQLAYSARARWGNGAGNLCVCALFMVLGGQALLKLLEGGSGRRS